MRTFAMIAGLALAAVAVLPPTAQAGCRARDTGTLFDAIAGLLDHVLPGRADNAATSAPEAADATADSPAPKCPPGRTKAFETVRAQSRTLYAEAPRYGALNCRLQAPPTYDASGMATYRPTRVCERY